MKARFGYQEPLPFAAMLRRMADAVERGQVHFRSSELTIPSQIKTVFGWDGNAYAAPTYEPSELTITVVGLIDVMRGFEQPALPPAPPPAIEIISVKALTLEEE